MKRALLVWSVAVVTFIASQAWADDILKHDGCVDQAVFDLTWQKYSDFDDRVPSQSQSVPVQEYEKVQERIGAANTEIAKLTALMELDRQRRLALRDYQEALAKGLKANLLKAFWRLTWITYSTIGGPSGKGGMVSAGKDMAEVLAGDFMGEFITVSAKVGALGKTVGVVKEVIPKTYTKFQGEPGQEATIADKAGNTAVDGILETLKSVDDNPLLLGAKVASKVVESAGNEALGDADLSADEIEILRSQNLENERLKKMIAQSYQVNGQRKERIAELTAQITALEEYAASLKEREKERVFALLNENCNRCGAGERWDVVTATCQSAGEPRPADGSQGPVITFGRPFLAPSQTAYDVGDTVKFSQPYRVEGLPEGETILLVPNYRITGNSFSYRPHWDAISLSNRATKAAGGPEIYSDSFKIEPDFSPGDYRIEVDFDFLPEGVAIEPPVLTFQVSGLYAGADYLLSQGMNLIEQCKPLDAEALLQQVPAAVRGKTSPYFVTLAERASQAIERAQAVAGQMAANLDKLRLAEDLLNQCQADNSINVLYALKLDDLPASCAEPFRSKAGLLRAQAEERVAVLGKMRELLAAGKKDFDACRFAEAAAAGTDPVFGTGQECEEEAKLGGEAAALAREAEKREAARRTIEEQLGKGELALAEGRPDEAAALANQVIAANDGDPGKDCYPEQRARAEALLTPSASQEGVVAVAITGARQALQGQQLHLGSAITVDGVPVQDVDAFAYRWENAAGKSVTGKKSVTFTARSPGEKVLRLTVTDPQGRSATTAATIFVPKLLQVSIAAAKAEAATGEKVPMTASISAEEELCPCTFAWRAVGINQTFTNNSVWFGYQKPGQYAVTLDVKDRFGQAASASHFLAVKGKSGNPPGPAVSTKDQEERESLRRERELYQAREREQLERERQEQERLERERRERERREAQERARQEEERRRLAEAEGLRREKQERENQEDDPFFGDLRNRQGSGGKSGSTLGDALFNAVEQIGRANEEHRRESERIEREWRQERRKLEEQRQQEREQRERQEQEERERQEAARAKCERERQSLRERLAGWQKGLDCLEEGKRKYPGKWLDCNGHWTMRDREVEIRDHRQWVSNGQSRLDTMNCE